MKIKDKDEKQQQQKKTTKNATSNYIFLSFKNKRFFQKILILFDVKKNNHSFVQVC